MSNKIVPGIYRAVIDDVVAAIKPEFDEYGVGEDVLAELQQKWQQKVIASGVAEFEPPAAPPPPLPTHAYPLHPLIPGVGPQPLPAYPTQGPYVAAAIASASAAAAAAAVAGAGPGAPNIKLEPTDPRYPLMQYQLPTLPGPQLGGAGGAARPGAPPVLQYSPPQGVNGQVRPQSAQQTMPKYQPPAPAGNAIPQTDGPSGGIPQVDGPSSSSSEDESSFAPPRANHPSLPQPSQAASSSAVPDDEAINSDLDDSDDEEGDDEDGTAGATKDLVFCTYDKVARVRNKWKCVLKDGMIHINGKDYLFSKCTGEFEW